MSSAAKARVFISYAHADAEWKDRLVRHLDVLDDKLFTWHDREIAAGDDWLARIRTELDAAAIAVLLVSADSLASPFIRDVELKRLLERRQTEGLRVVRVLVRPCAWKGVPWLAQMELRPQGHALSARRKHQVEADLAAIAGEIAAAVRPTHALSSPGDATPTDVPWDARDDALLRYYYRLCGKQHRDLRAIKDVASPASLRYLVSSGLLAEVSGRRVLTQAGLLLFGQRDEIPRTVFHIDVSVHRHDRAETLNRRYYGSVLYLYKKLTQELKFLWIDPMGSPDRRDSDGAEGLVFDCPKTAVKEALVNFLIHRDYRLDDLARIRIHADRVEFTNPGRSDYPPKVLLDTERELEPKYSTNRSLIKAMYHAGLNQQEGAGILRIKQALRANGTVLGGGRPALSISVDSARTRFTLGVYRRNPALTGTILAGGAGEQHDPAARLAHLYERRDAARAADDPVSVERLTAEIVSVKRRLRETGQLQAGDFLDDGCYQLIERIGEGGFATVWKAYDRRARCFVAIKVLHAAGAMDQSGRARFFRGAQQMARLDHPAIVRVFKPHGEDGGWHYFVMEYVAGEDLDKAVRGGRVGPGNVPQIILALADALTYAHERGLVHYAVLPTNIVLDAKLRPQLTDFDLVRTDTTTGGTRTSVMGKFLYTAPEVMSRPQDADARADVYSLAMTAIFAYAGRPLDHDVLYEQDAYLAALPCAPAVREVLARAVKPKPAARFASMREFADALRRAVAPPRSVRARAEIAAPPSKSTARTPPPALHDGRGERPSPPPRSLSARSR